MAVLDILIPDVLHVLANWTYMVIALLREHLRMVAGSPFGMVCRIQRLQIDAVDHFIDEILDVRSLGINSSKLGGSNINCC